MGGCDFNAGVCDRLKVVGDFDAPYEVRKDQVKILERTATHVETSCDEWGNAENAPWESAQGNCITGYCVCFKRSDPYPVYSFRGAPSDPDRFIVNYAYNFSGDTVKKARSILDGKLKAEMTEVGKALGKPAKSPVICEAADQYKYKSDMICRSAPKRDPNFIDKLVSYFDI